MSREFGVPHCVELFGDESAVNREEAVADSSVYKSSILRTMTGWTSLTGKRSCTLVLCFGQFVAGLVEVMDTPAFDFDL